MSDLHSMHSITIKMVSLIHLPSSGVKLPNTSLTLIMSLDLRSSMNHSPPPHTEDYMSYSSPMSEIIRTYCPSTKELAKKSENTHPPNYYSSNQELLTFSDNNSMIVQVVYNTEIEKFTVIISTAP